MASITIRRLDDALKARLRVLAARHGRSMEQEAREILRERLLAEKSQGPSLADSIRRRMAPFGGAELALPARAPMRRPPNLAR